MAEHSDDILSVLRTITPFFAQHTASQEMYHLLVAAFTALQVLTSGNEHEGEHCIRAFLLDHLAQDSQGIAAQKNATRLLRKCLQEWIAQYADAQSMLLRQHILNDLLYRFQRQPSSALCWTFSSPGYRDERIVKALWQYALEHEGETSDTALATSHPLNALNCLQKCIAESQSN